MMLALGVIGVPLASGQAGAATPAGPPALVQGEAWCGHYSHASARSLPPHFTCPASDPSAGPVTLVTDAPDGPFSSGQYVTVMVDPDHVLDPGKHIYIRECAAPDGRPPTSWRQCDLKTNQDAVVTVGAHGALTYPGYPIYALPDGLVLGERTRHRPLCDLTHACILFVGQDRHDFDRPHVWSLPFFVHPTPGDTGADPGNGLPEVPYVLALPILAVGILGGTVAIRRRRDKLDRPLA